MIQAIFFDIDGTLIPFDKETMPKSTLMALWKAKEKGVKLFVATGRAPNNIDHVKKLFPFDGFLTANGQYCFNHDSIIHERYICQEDVKNIIPYIEENKIPIIFITLDSCYRNKYNINDTRWPIADLSTLIDQPLIQMIAIIDESEDETLLSHLPHCKSARWNPRSIDIIPSDGGKDTGIDEIIKYYHIPLENVMAFGDSGNDLSMLKHVGYGIAMGNASETIKKQVPYTTTDIEDNGILNALLHFEVLKKEDIK